MTRHYKAVERHSAHRVCSTAVAKTEKAQHVLKQTRRRQRANHVKPRKKKKDENTSYCYPTPPSVRDSTTSDTKTSSSRTPERTENSLGLPSLTFGRSDPLDPQGKQSPAHWHPRGTTRHVSSTKDGGLRVCIHERALVCMYVDPWRRCPRVSLHEFVCVRTHTCEV